MARASAENILAANCGACHGPALTPQQALDGINFIDDLAELTERGYLVPLNSPASRIIQVMRDGSMPPRSSGLPPVTEADIDIVAQYIDNPRFWPEVPTVPGPAAPDAGAEPPLGDAATLSD